MLTEGLYRIKQFINDYSDIQSADFITQHNGSICFMCFSGDALLWR